MVATGNHQYLDSLRGAPRSLQYNRECIPGDCHRRQSRPRNDKEFVGVIHEDIRAIRESPLRYADALSKKRVILSGASKMRSRRIHAPNICYARMIMRRSFDYGLTPSAQDDRGWTKEVKSPRATCTGCVLQGGLFDFCVPARVLRGRGGNLLKDEDGMYAVVHRKFFHRFQAES